MKTILQFFILLIFTTGITQNGPIDFETGGQGADWTWTVFENDDNPPLEIVLNPDPSGVNTSATVAKFIARAGGQPWAGTESAHGSPIGTFDLTSENAQVNIMVYKTKISDVGIKLVTPTGAAQAEIKVANTLINQWELISFNFSGNIGLGETTGLDQIVVFPDFEARSVEEVVYFDNITFGPFEGDSVELPVDFESATANYNVIGFGNVDVAVEANPDPSGINTSNTVVRSTKTVGAEFWGGVEMSLDTAIDFSASEMISIKTWSPKADIPVRLKIEDGTGWFLELDVNTTVDGQWEILTWDFTGQTAGVDVNKVVVFFEFIEGLPGDGSVYYYDDIEVFTPVVDLVELPVDFESATANYNVIGFGNVDVAVEANPDPSGINTSNTVVRSTKTVGAEFWGGVEMSLDTAIDFSASEMISIKTWSPKADIPVRLKIEDGTGWFLELDVNTTVEGQWEILTWDFTGQTAGVDVNKVVVFFEFIEGLPGDGSVYYYDDIEVFTPVVDLVELPVDFESATANYNVIGFGNVDVAVEANPDSSGINTSNTVVRSTKTVGAEFWGGVEMSLDTAIDFSASEMISIKTWSPKADIPVRLKIEDGTGWFLELDVNTTVEGQWEILTWDFTGQTAGVDVNKVVVFFEFIEGLPGDGSVYYYDDIEVFTPVVDLVELPVDFESATANYNVIGFGNVDVAVEANPDSSGINTSNTVVRSTKTVGAEFWGGVEMSLDTAIDFSASEMISIKTWSPKADIPVRLKIEDGTGWFLELDVNTTVEGQWEILTWDFTGQTAGVDVNKVVVFFEFIEGLPGDGSVYYYDDIEVFTPVVDLVELPVDFESATANYNVIGFGNVDVAVEANPDSSGINTSNTVVRSTKTVGAEFWGGVEMSLDTAIDFSASEMISIKTWSPKADIPVRLKIEDGTGWFLELDVNTTVEGQWEILTWDFTGQTAGVDVNKVVVFFEFIEGLPGDGSVYYYDDIEVFTPVVDLVELPVDFESATANYNVIGFGNVDVAVEANPDPSGINTSNTVVRSTKTVGAEFWGGVEMSLDTAIDFSASEMISIKTWSPKADIPVRLKIEDGTGWFLELDVNTTVEGQWEILTWDFTGQTAGVDVNKVVVFFEFIEGLPGDGSTYYYDNIEVVVPLIPSLPITLEEEVNPNFQDFSGSETEVISNPYPEGINPSEKVAQNIVPANTSFAGVSFDVSTIDLSLGNTFNLDVRAILPDAPILLKLENTVNGTSIEREIILSTINEWENITFDFGTEADATYDKVTLFMYFNSPSPLNRVAYWDNLEQNLNDLVELPVTFESATANYNVIGFEGADSAVEANPDPSGINTSNTVVRTTKTEGAAFFAGTGMGLDVPIDFSETESISMKTWSPKANIPVRLKLEGSGGQVMELDVNTTVTNEWETLTWNFSGQTAGVDWLTVVIFFEFIVDLPGDGSTYYYDDIDLAPQIGDLVELPVTFESATADYNVIGFEGADSAVEANPDPSGINTSNTVVRTTKTEGAAFFAGTGMGLDVPIDFSETESISMKTWSPKADIPVRLKLEGPGGEFIELDVNTTVENEWETLTWDFSGQTAGVDWLTVVLFFEFVVDLPGDGSTYYYDDIELALPVSDLVELPVDFESTTIDYNVIGFEGADSAVEANPDPSGINTSNTVVRTTKTEGAAFFAGTGMGLDVPIDFSETESISMKTWSPKADIPVRLKLEGPGGEFIELDVNTTVENEWETLTWDFSGQTAGVDWLTVVLFFEFVVDLPGDGSTYYYDDIELALPVSDLVELPVTFESATADYNVIGFEGADSAVEANPDPSGINTSNTVVRTTKTEGAAFFAGTGMGLDVPIDFSETESISMKTWSPKADIPVRLKLEGPGGEFIELDVNTTVENEWETLTWDFSGQTAGVDWLTVVLFFEFVVDLPGDGSTYYYDDIELAESTSELNAPISFEPGEFGNTWTWTVFENDDNPPLEIIANPDPSGVNTSNTVAKFTARTEGQPFAGVESLHGADLGVFDLTSETSTVTIMVWKTKISDVGIKFATPSGGAQPEIKVANTLVNQWEELTFDFSDYIGLGETTGLDQIIIFPDFIDREADDIIYFDNITIGSSVSTPLQLPVDFESTTIDYNVIGFEGADSAVEANPDPSGINTSNTVVRTTKTEGAAFFAGTGMGLDVPIDFSETESISMKTWSPKADIPVRLKLEGPGGEFIELDVNTTVENEWETLTWDFSGQTAGVDWLTVVLFFEFVVDLPGDGSTYYYDDIELADNPLSISDTILSTVVSYPNPVKTIWNVQAQETITDIVIYNLFGQRIIAISPHITNVTLNMSEMRPGVYLAHVFSDQGTEIIKIIKE